MMEENFKMKCVICNENMNVTHYSLYSRYFCKNKELQFKLGVTHYQVITNKRNECIKYISLKDGISIKSYPNEKHSDIIFMFDNKTVRILCVPYIDIKNDFNGSMIDIKRKLIFR